MAIIGALAPGGFVIGLGEFEIMGLMPNVAGDFKVSEQSIGQLISPYALGVVIGAPMLDSCGRLQPKTLLIGLMALYALSKLRSALA